MIKKKKKKKKKKCLPSLPSNFQTETRSTGIFYLALAAYVHSRYYNISGHRTFPLKHRKSGVKCGHLDKRLYTVCSLLQNVH